ncbi:MAG: hypothetical protein ACK4NX_00540, partial [Candidatus Paceibacteria bacterium]
MPKEVRSVIFLILIVFFLFAGPIVVSWSQGYRFDLASGKITHVGGLFLRPEPIRATITILRKAESRLDKGTLIVKNIEPSLFYSGFLVKNLLPRTYDVKVDAGAKYFTWEKKLNVAPLEVARATHIILLPKELEVSILENATSI